MDLAAEADKADRQRTEALQRSLIDLGVAWGLALMCCTHHMGHWLHSLGYHSMAHGALMSTLGHPWISGLLGAFALVGPGRGLIKDGALSLYRSVGQFLALRLALSPTPKRITRLSLIQGSLVHDREKNDAIQAGVACKSELLVFHLPFSYAFRTATLLHKIYDG